MADYTLIPGCGDCEHNPDCPWYDAVGRVPVGVDCPLRREVDMEKGPKTTEEARALPEMTEVEVMAGPISWAQFDGDTIFAFVDDDGRAMKVENHYGRWVKVPF